MLATIRRSFALLGVLALAACGAPSDPSTVVAPEVNAKAVASGGQRPPVPKIDWAPCGEEFPGTECTTALVPLDYNHPGGPKIAIALARIPATDQKRRIGSLFINPGGPGGSGVWQILYGYPFFNNLETLLQGRFDIVGFDPRGTGGGVGPSGGSEPLYCFRTQDEEIAWVTPFPWFPWRKDYERWVFDEWQFFTGKCLGSGQRILSHMSTADVARDLDLLRQAVGDKRLNYLGFSYGTYLGQTYANLFPDRVRALVLDGVLDPRAWSTGWSILYWRTSGDREFNEYLRLCDEAGQDTDGTYYCPLSGPEGAASRWNALAERIQSEPFPTGFVFPDGSSLTYDNLIYLALVSLYDPGSWVGSDGWTAYFASLADAALGDSTAAVRAAGIRRAIQARMADASIQQEQYQNEWPDAQTGVQCADVEYPRSFETWSTIGKFAGYQSTFGSFWWWYFSSCATWPVNSDRYVGPWEVRTSAPVLLVGNYFDGITDYAGAVAASKLLRNSRLLSFAGWGHTAFGQSTATPCVTEHVVRYILDGTLPPEGTVCPAPPNPFLPTPALKSLRPATGGRPVVRPPAWLLRR